MAGRPFTKEMQLARGDTPKHRRNVASKQRWVQIVKAKAGPCRVCGKPWPNDPAHLVGRGQGGPDSEWNIVPLCRDDHARYDAHDAGTCRKLAETLTDQEYAGLIEFGGEAILERRFHVRFEDAR